MGVTLDDGSVLRTVTRSGAATLGGKVDLYRDGHTAVIWLKSIPGSQRFVGCYLLDRVRVPTWDVTVDEANLVYNRASGLAECPVCDLPLSFHPEDLDHPSCDGKPFLVRQCDGSLVKL